jgi:uncharacterized membrane protein YfcA
LHFGWLFYAVAVPAVVLLGLSKGGFAGVGAIAMPMLSLVISPVQAAAIVLPILIVQDVVGVWAFRHSWDGFVLAWMIPGAVVGIALGYLFAASVSVVAITVAVGLVSLVYGGWQLFRTWLGHLPVERRLPGPVGAALGVASGFTSQIAHAGQPPFQLWVLPMRLPRDVLIGTTAIYFASLNWVKVPAYWALGQFSAANLMAAASLMPVAIGSTFAGVWLVRRIDADRFYTAIHWLMVLLGGLLLWEAFR